MPIPILESVVRVDARVDLMVGVRVIVMVPAGGMLTVTQSGQ